MENLSYGFEAQLLGLNSGRDKVRGLIVSGFLGAGKTSLIRHLVKHKGNLSLALLVNDLSSLNIDALLLDLPHQNLPLGAGEGAVSGGCVCCSSKEEAKGWVSHILSSPISKPDFLVIETSGAADPRPLAASLHSLLRIDQVVTVVDGSNIDAALTSPVGRAQLQGADVVIVNKMDLVSGDGSLNDDDLVSKVRQVTNARLLQSVGGEVPLEQVMDVQRRVPQALPSGAAHLSHDPISQPIFYQVGGGGWFHDKSKQRAAELHDKHAHHDGFHNLPLIKEGRIYFCKFQEFVHRFLLNRGVVRAKGLFCFAEAPHARYEFHVSGLERVELREEAGGWKTQPFCKIVVICGEELPCHSQETSTHRFSAEEMSRAFSQCAQPPTTEEKMQAEEIREQLEQMIGSDPRFELVPRRSRTQDSHQQTVQTGGLNPSQSKLAEDENTPVVLFGVAQTTDMRLYGVYSEEVNRELCALINASKLPFLLLPLSSPSSPQVLIHLAPQVAYFSQAPPSIKGEEGKEDKRRQGSEISTQQWTRVRDGTASIIASKPIPSCKCGF